MNTYITFGQIHVHRVNGKTFDCDTVAVIQAENENAGREKAFEYFGDKWHQSFDEKSWKPETLSYFPKGLLHVERNSEPVRAAHKRINPQALKEYLFDTARYYRNERHSFRKREYPSDEALCNYFEGQVKSLIALWRAIKRQQEKNITHLGFFRD